MGRLFSHRPYLDRQADRIERALSSIDLPARVQGGQIGKHWVRYHLAPVSGTRADQVALAAEAVADAIGVAGLRIAEQPQGLSIDVPLGQGAELRLLPLLHSLPGLSALTAVVGMLTTGTPLIFNLTKQSTWNLLISAPRGCGKSELIRTLMISLALTSKRSQLTMLGIDIGGRELAVLESLPHALTELATEPGFAAELLIWLSEEVKRRLSSGVASPHVVLMVDDLEWLASRREVEAISALTHIARHGVDAGVHFIAATQTGLPPALGDLLDSQELVEVGPIENGKDYRKVMIGRFQFASGVDIDVADVAWLSLHDLDTAARLVNAGWRATGMLPLTDVEVAR